MRIIICGGSLQGVELCFLAKQAGWYSILLDAQDNAPASCLADQMICQDITCLETASAEIHDLFKSADLVIPATENQQALQALTAFCQKHTLPFAFDQEAYSITASKIRSRELFTKCNTPIPTPFTAHDTPAYPLIAKPAFGSGSQGVQIFHNAASFEKIFPLGTASPDWLFEAYCEGPSYSIEICGIPAEMYGTPAKYTTFTVTKLHMDALFDCEAVSTPSGLSAEAEASLADEATRLAKALNLHGIMDLEVIWTPNGYVVLEIDARFPSQTPTAVYLAEGINLIEHLAACYIDRPSPQKAHAPRPVWYEHVTYNGHDCSTRGEHMMTTHGPLQSVSVCPPFDILLGQSAHSWVATLMLYDLTDGLDVANFADGASPEHVKKLRETCLQNLISIFPIASTA